MKRYSMKTGRELSPLSIRRVSEIPPTNSEDIGIRSKYARSLYRLSRKRKGYMFRISNGGMNAKNLYQGLNVICKKAKIKNLRFTTRKDVCYCEVV